MKQLLSRIAWWEWAIIALNTATFISLVVADEYSEALDVFAIAFLFASCAGWRAAYDILHDKHTALRVSVTRDKGKFL